jgi:hypothetical protein
MAHLGWKAEMAGRNACATYNPPVRQRDDAVRPIAERSIMRCQQNCDPPLVRQALEQLDDRLAGLRVQVPSRLVRHQDLRVCDQRPRDRHALHLPARELPRQVIGAIGEPHRPQHFQRTRAVHPALQKHQRQLYVLRYRECRQQRELLEHETEHAAPNLHQLFLRQPGDALARHHQVALGGRIQTGQQVHERRLARP